MRSTAVAVAVSLSLFTAAFTASADEGKGPTHATELKTRHAAHMDEARARMARVPAMKLDADKAKLLRVRFEGSVVKTSAAANEAVADGTVTKDAEKR
jgi:hypothetical protein